MKRTRINRPYQQVVHLAIAENITNYGIIHAKGYTIFESTAKAQKLALQFFAKDAKAI
jgi:hypothetical protein